MTDLPSRNTKISLISLVALGIAAISIVAYNIDKWLAGGVAVRKIAQACDVLGDGCSNASSSIFQIIGSPQQLILSAALAALLLAFIRAVVVIVKARRLASRYTYPAQSYPKVYKILQDLGAEDLRIKIADDNGVSAFTYGVLKPAICISKGLTEKLSNSELTTLIAHEVGHVKRRDNFAIFLGLFIRDFLWPLPISHHLFSIFLHEKEFAADDFAIQMTGKPLDLAGAIVSVAKAVQSERVLSPAYATFFSSRATAKARVSRLLGSGDRTKPSLTRLMVSMLLSLVIAISVIGLAYAQPSPKAGTYGKCEMGKDCEKLGSKCCNL